MQGIKLTLNHVGAQSDIALIGISGYVDTTTCQELARVIQELEKQKCYHIITDLGGVTYISSAGWGVFMGEIKKIRDRSGDLKIVHMSPEVFEVFEMLEFNRILNYYDSVTEAIDEFDILRGIDITKKHEPVKRANSDVSKLPYMDAEIHASVSDSKMKPAQSEKKNQVKNLPLQEKIKRTIVHEPDLSSKGIRKRLNSDEYGFVRINRFRLKSLLKKMNLETKEKRHRFFRSR